MTAVKIYNFMNYKDFINSCIKSCPNNGRGQLLKMAKFLTVHSTLISQVLRGHKDFTLEQTFKLTEYFGLNEIEKEYFITLVQYEKAGTHDLKNYFKEKLQKTKNKFQQVSSRVVAKTELNEEDKALYYSDWAYMAVWLLTSMPGFEDVTKIAEHVGLPPKRISKIMEFLFKTGLCKEEKDGIGMGVSKTHLESNSPLITRHHTNWRLKAVENFEKMNNEELAFSAPLTISKKDFGKIKNDILEFIEKTSKTVASSQAEKLSCLNIDFFDVK